MRLLQCGGFCHRKNDEGIRLMTSALGIEYVNSNEETRYQENWDFVFIPSEYITPDRFPNAKLIIYGPHNFVFPNGVWTTVNMTNNNKVYYNLLAKWVTKYCNEVSQFESNFNIIELPFAVDVERFKPVSEKVYERDCFLYFKDTNIEKLQKAEELCNKLGLTYEKIIYGQYQEKRYIHILNTSKFGIWIGRHESQGFAVEEALSMNIPLVVWDPKTMFEEMVHGNMVYRQYQNKCKLEASCIPYWDDNCGIVVDEATIESGIRHMVEHYRDYAPRDFVVRELSPAVCMQRWVDLLKH